jgi:hypothetical protein
MDLTGAAWHLRIEEDPMKLDDVRPADCHARALRVLGEVNLIRDEMGRTEDARPVPEVVGAAPREVYFEALALWNKVDRLARELGATAIAPPLDVPPLGAIKPGHVLGVIDSVLGQLVATKGRLGIGDAAVEPQPDASRQPADVLATLIRANRELSRALERPFTPEDVYRQVAHASMYVAQVLAARDVTPPGPARFERRRKPADCYQRLEACLMQLAVRIGAAGETALTMRGTPADVVPGDVYDLATLVLGEAAFLHSLTPSAGPVHGFAATAGGFRLPAHVHQLARTLEGQLIALG